MKKFVLLVMLALKVVVVSAADNTDVSVNWIDLFLKSFNFIVLVGLIYYFAKNKVVKYLKSIVSSQYTEFNQSNIKENSLQVELEQINKKLLETEQILETKKQNALNEIKRQQDKILSSSQNYMKKLEQQAQARMKQNLDEAKRKIKIMVVEQSFGKINQRLKNQESQNYPNNLINFF